MKSNGGGRLSPDRLGMIVLVTLGLSLSFLVIRNAAIGLTVDRDPERALRLNPSSAVALDAAARHIAARGDAASADAAARLARNAIRESPLLARPFVYVAMQQEMSGHLAAAIAVMSIAVNRDPRSVTARSWLLQRYLEIGDYAGAIAQVDALSRLQPRLAANFAIALVSLLYVPEARAPLLETLAQNPAWQSDFLAAAVRNLGSHKAIYALLTALVARPGVQLQTERLSLLLNDIVHNGDVGVARSIFNRVSGPNDDAGGLVFDGGFRHLAAPGPFNWGLTGSSSGTASFEQDSVGGTSLLVRRFGTEAASLMGQMLSLGPGRYRLSTRVRGEEGALDGSLGWRVSCLDGRALARLDTPQAGRNPVDIATEFVVPAACDGQQLLLRAEATDGSAGASARFGTVAIRRIGDARDAQ